MHRLATSIAFFALALPALAELPLTLEVEGTTAGVIVGPQSTCPPACAQSVGSNQLVKLTARSVSSTFLGWEKGTGPAKACSDTKADCSFTMTEPASITARFGAGIPLTVSRIGELGSARNLQSSVFPVEIQCPPDCEGTFAAGSQVELRSEPTLVLGHAGLAFLGWSGGAGSAVACVGTSQTCRFTITQPSSLSFQFEKRATARIEVGFVGSGSLSIGFNPPMGGATLSGARPSCAHVGNLNVPVSVSIVPGSNTAFTRWVGGPCDGQTTTNCLFTLLGPVSMKVQATRTDITETTHLQILGIGNADGRVTATVLSAGVPPVDVDCRYDHDVDGRVGGSFGPCGATLPVGTVVKLEAIPTKDPANQREPEFKGWFEGTGSASVCTGKSSATCQFALTSFSTVKAKFCRAVLGCLGQ